MKINSLRSYRAPKVPFRDYVDDHPEILKIIPVRWENNPIVLSALAGAIILCVGSKAIATDKQPKVSNVAPIFEHGNGQGSFGCIVVSPPVFLSEEEARQVIIEEGKAFGINFELNNSTTPLELKITGYDEVFDKKTNKIVRKEKVFDVKDVIDGVDLNKKIYFEFISKDDYKSNIQQLLKVTSTVITYNIKDYARMFRDGLDKAKINGGKYIVFYDPVSHTDREYPNLGKNWRETKKQESLEKSRTELRKQVQDFIKWLKAEGVI